MSDIATTGDVIAHGKWSALVLQAVGDKLAIVTIRSSKSGRHRSDIPIDLVHSRIPVQRPVIQCRAFFVVPNSRIKVLDGINARHLVKTVSDEVVREQERTRREQLPRVGEWHREAAREMPAIW